MIGFKWLIRADWGAVLCFLITPLIASVWALTAFWLGLMWVLWPINWLPLPPVFPDLYFPVGYCLILNPRKSKPGFSVFPLYSMGLSVWHTLVFSGLSYLKIGWRWLAGVVHKARPFLRLDHLFSVDPFPCFASRKARQDYYGKITFSFIQEFEAFT